MASRYQLFGFNVNLVVLWIIVRFLFAIKKKKKQKKLVKIKLRVWECFKLPWLITTSVWYLNFRYRTPHLKLLVEDLNSRPRILIFGRRFEAEFVDYNNGQNIWEKLVFIWNSALREKFNFCFEGVFASIDKIFFLGGRLGTRV